MSSKVTANPESPAEIPPRSGWKKRLITAVNYTGYAVVIVSLLWTLSEMIFGWPHQSHVQIWSILKRSAVCLGLITFVAEPMFIIGMLLGIVSLRVSAKGIFAGTGRNPLKWWGAIERERKEWRTYLGRINRDPLFLTGFYLNMIGALGTGIVMAVAIMWALPVTAWGLLFVPVADIAATLVVRAAVLKKLRESDRQPKPRVVIRNATMADVAGIVKLDAHSYGDITEAQTTDPVHMFTERIRNSPGWFLVAELDGKIEGLLSAQQMRFDPASFVSWDKTTRNGTLAGTYDPTSKIVYVPALTVSSRGSRADATDALMVKVIQRFIRHGICAVYFAARMPDFHKHAADMTAEDYYDAKRSTSAGEVALDPQIMFYEKIGMKRVRLVKGGFIEDWKSCGYSVLFQYNVTFSGLPCRWFWAWLFGVLALQEKRFAYLVKKFS